MELRKKIVYGIFAVSVVYGFYFHVIREDGINTDSAEDMLSSNSPIAAANLSGPGTALAAEEPARLDDSPEEWSRNPFRYQRHANGPKKKNVAEPRKLTLPRLTAISRSSGKSMAAVNGQIIEVGNKIGPWRLIQITRDAALFEGPHGRIWVKLGE
jgi:hypothetical protein